jgi:TRAP-type C4-dicarboxylate transport system permease small subunit
MKRMLGITLRLSKLLNAISGITLTFTVLLTTADVIMRYLGKPILGSYELAGLSGAVLIGFALPYASWTRSHINMDFLILKLPKKGFNILVSFTRILSILLFASIGVYLFKKGIYLYRSGEVSLTLKMPYYPIACGIGICCFFVCLVLFCDIIKLIGGEYE